MATRYQLLLQTQCYVFFFTVLSPLHSWFNAYCMIWSLGHKLLLNSQFRPPSVLSVVPLPETPVFYFLPSFCSFLASCKTKDWTLYSFLGPLSFLPSSFLEAVLIFTATNDSFRFIYFFQVYLSTILTLKALLVAVIIPPGHTDPEGSLRRAA